jgi:parvulin-like peptidyl-prolyl isomerase
MELMGKTVASFGKHLLRWPLPAFFALFAAFLPMACTPGAVKPAQEEIASVNGEPITRADLAYVLEVAHRREDLESGGQLSISDYIQKLIGETLIIQEARDMGLENDREIKRQVDFFILTESVGMLHKEEILEKIKFTDQEVLDTYNSLFQTFTMDAIATGSEEDAKKALEGLSSGRDFKEMAIVYSEWYNQQAPDPGKKEEEGAGAQRITLSLKALSGTPKLKEALLAMKPGEMSGIITEPDIKKFFIVKLIEKKDPNPSDMAHIRKKMESFLKKEKETKRSDEYLKELRAKAKVEINQDVLDRVVKSKLDDPALDKDETVVARVDEDVLTVRQYVEIVRRAIPKNLKSDLLENWILLRVVDKEALGRKYYEKDPDLKERTKRYKDQLLKAAFIQKVIVPQIKLGEDDAKKYYSENMEKFSEPAKYKYQQITVQEQKGAEDILAQLKGGVDFDWLAKDRSRDSARLNGGHMGWREKNELPSALKEIIDRMKPGELSPVLNMDPEYAVVKLEEAKKGEVPPFDAVKEKAMSMAYSERFSKVWNEYVSKLKERADIRINDAVVRGLEDTFKPKADSPKTEQKQS